MRFAVVDEAPERIRHAVRPFQVSENGLAEPGASAWAAINRAAHGIERAKVRSERVAAYAELVVGCSRCHAGEAATQEVGEGHGGGFAAMDLGVVYADGSKRALAVERVGGAPNLAASAKRLTQLTERLRTLEDPAQQARFLRKTYTECIRCHGPSSPFQLSR